MVTLSALDENMVRGSGGRGKRTRPRLTLFLFGVGECGVR